MPGARELDAYGLVDRDRGLRDGHAGLDGGRAAERLEGDLEAGEGDAPVGGKRDGEALARQRELVAGDELGPRVVTDECALAAGDRLDGEVVPAALQREGGHREPEAVAAAARAHDYGLGAGAVGVVVVAAGVDDHAGAAGLGARAAGLEQEGVAGGVVLVDGDEVGPRDRVAHAVAVGGVEGHGVGAGAVHVAGAKSVAGGAVAEVPGRGAGVGERREGHRVAELADAGLVDAEADALGEGGGRSPDGLPGLGDLRGAHIAGPEQHAGGLDAQGGRLGVGARGREVVGERGVCYAEGVLPADARDAVGGAEFVGAGLALGEEVEPVVADARVGVHAGAVDPEVAAVGAGVLLEVGVLERAEAHALRVHLVADGVVAELVGAGVKAGGHAEHIGEALVERARLTVVDEPGREFGEPVGELVRDDVDGRERRGDDAAGVAVAVVGGLAVPEGIGKVEVDVDVGDHVEAVVVDGALVEVLGEQVVVALHAPVRVAGYFVLGGVGPGPVVVVVGELAPREAVAVLGVARVHHGVARGLLVEAVGAVVAAVGGEGLPPGVTGVAGAGLLGAVEALLAGDDLAGGHVDVGVVAVEGREAVHVDAVREHVLGAREVEVARYPVGHCRLEGGRVAQARAAGSALGDAAGLAGVDGDRGRLPELSRQHEGAVAAQGTRGVLVYVELGAEHGVAAGPV